MDRMARTFTFQIDPEIREALEKEAVEKERSIAFLINRRLRSSLEADQYLPPKSAAREPKI
jgi:methyltransferase-like protein